MAEVSCGFIWMRLGNAQGWKFPHFLMKTLFLMPSLWFVLRPLVPSPTIEKSLALLSAYIWLADELVMIPNSTNFLGPELALALVHLGAGSHLYRQTDGHHQTDRCCTRTYDHKPLGSRGLRSFSSSAAL